MLATSTRIVRAQSKPDKLVYIGENQGGWKRVLMEEVGPAFEKATGIKVEFTMMPVDAWRARLKAELGAGSSGIDIAQWSVGMAGWMSPHLLDHEPLVAKMAARDPAFDWGDFLAGSKLAASYDGKLSGIPYRITTGILHYQKPVLEKAGFTQAPGHLRGVRAHRAGGQFTPRPLRRRSHGQAGIGPLHQPRLVAVLGRRTAGGLQDRRDLHQRFARPSPPCSSWRDLVVKHKVTPPEVTTWEYDEIIAGGQRDRYVMAQTFAPYGTLINDPAVSKTAGRWAWSVVPGHTDKAQSRTWIDGHFLAVPKYAKHADWSLEFIRMACSKEWMLRSMERGNAPPRGSVLRDPAMVSKIGWPPVAAAAIETGIPTPAHPAWDTLELSLRTGVSETLLGQKTAKQALDAVAADWQRSLRRAGIGR